MADDNQMQLDITPLRGVFSSIQTSLDSQTSILKEMVEGQKEQAKILEKQAKIAQRRQSQTDVTGSNASGGVGKIFGGSLAKSSGEALGSLAGGGFGIGSLLTSLGSGLGSTAGSLAGIGVGIAGFFTALAGADWAIEKLGDGSNLTTLMKNMSDGLSSLDTPALLGLGALVASQLFLPSKSFTGQVKMATGMTAIGAGIGGFFSGLALADEASSWMSADLSGFKTKMVNLAEGLSAFSSIPLAGAVTLGVLATSGLFAANTGFGTQFKIATGMTAIGAGIGGFFSGLALADEASSWMSTDLSGFKDKMKNLAEGLGAFGSTSGLTTLATLAGSALFAANSSFGTQFKVATGMTAIGLGIGGFFAGLSAAMAIPDLLGIDSGNIKTMLTNLGEGLNSFNSASLTAFGAMLGAGALFGVAGGPAVAGLAATGMSMIGLGIGGFLAAIDGVLAGASAIGIDGSSTKTLLMNISSGLDPLSKLDATGLTNIGNALVSVSAGIAAFLGADALGKVTGLVASGLDTIQNGINWLFGTSFGESSQPSVIQTIVDSLTPLGDLDESMITKMDTFGGAIGRFVGSFESLNNIQTSGISANLESMLRNVGGLLDALPFLLNGGTWSGQRLGFGDNISFGPEGEGGLNNLSAETIDRLKNGLAELYSALDVEANISARTAPTATGTDQTSALEALMAATAASAAQAAQAASAAAASAALAASRAGGSVVNNVNTTNITSDPIRSLDPALPGPS